MWCCHIAQFKLKSLAFVICVLVITVRCPYNHHSTRILTFTQADTRIILANMLPNRIGYILGFFDFCGFNSRSSKLFHSPKSIYSIRSVHILLVATYTIVQYVFFLNFFLSHGFIETINELTSSSMALFVFWLIIVDANLQQRAHKHFWSIFQHIDDNLFDQFNFTFRSYIIICVGFFLATISTFVMRSHFQDHVGFLIFLVYTGPIKINQIRLLYYIFCLKVMHFQLKSLEKASVTFNVLGTQKCKWVRLYYRSIYDMAMALNTTFGWSQVAVIPFCYFCLFADCNYIYIHSHEIAANIHIGEFCHWSF